MAELYPDMLCEACGGHHALYCQDPDRHPHGAVYRYTCPVTAVSVSFRPSATPERVVLAPGSALPMTWVSDGPAHR
jgi:hypothetical protein